MKDFATVANLLGALAFGGVMGWVTYGTLRRTKRTGITDISSVIGAVAGAAVTGLFPKESGTFGVYCVGLALGFFVYLVVAMNSSKAPEWLGESPDSAKVVETPPLPGEIKRP